MRKIYISLSLTNTPIDFINFIKEVKFDLKKQYEVLDFTELEQIKSVEVYEHSINCVLLSDFIVAICDYPSISLGYEISLALEKFSKPVIAFYKKGTKVSTFILGINHPMFTLNEYESKEDILNFIKEKELKHFKQSVQVDLCESDICKV